MLQLLIFHLFEMMHLCLQQGSELLLHLQHFLPLSLLSLLFSFYLLLVRFCSHLFSLSLTSLRCFSASICICCSPSLSSLCRLSASIRIWFCKPLAVFFSLFIPLMNLNHPCEGCRYSMSLSSVGTSFLVCLDIILCNFINYFYLDSVGFSTWRSWILVATNKSLEHTIRSPLPANVVVHTCTEGRWYFSRHKIAPCSWFNQVFSTLKSSLDFTRERRW